MFFVYVLQLSNEKYYIGQTNDLDSRLNRHQSGQVRSTKGFRPVKMVYSETFATRSESMQREKQLKSWKNHEAIENLINNFDGLIV